MNHLRALQLRDIGASNAPSRLLRSSSALDHREELLPGTRVHILKPYLAKLENVIGEGKEVKPMNLIVLTDGVPSDDLESALLSARQEIG